MSKIIEIPEYKIRQVIWMLKVGKTKKACCEHLSIPYNTKKLNFIVKNFKDKEIRIANLRKKAKKTSISDSIKKDIISRYSNGEAISRIAENYYITSPRVKKVLIDNNIPLRGRGKNNPGNVTHIIQNFDIKFNIGDKVFIKSKNTIGIVDKIFDEDYIEYLKQGYLKSIELSLWEKLKENEEPIEGIHYETYWYLDNGILWGKRKAFEHYINNIEEAISINGRENYRVWCTDEQLKGFYIIKRIDLYPIGNINDK